MVGLSDRDDSLSDIALPSLNGSHNHVCRVQRRMNRLNVHLAFPVIEINQSASNLDLDRRIFKQTRRHTLLLSERTALASSVRDASQPATSVPQDAPANIGVKMQVFDLKHETPRRTRTDGVTA